MIVPVGGKTVTSSGSVTTLSISYSPVVGNCLLLFFQVNQGTGYTGLSVKDNHGNTVPVGPQAGAPNIACAYQFPVPSGVTGYTATWTDGNEACIAVEEYSGVIAVNPAYNGNVATGNSGSPNVSATISWVGGNWIVCAMGSLSGNTLTGNVGNVRQNTATGTPKLIVMDNTSSSLASLSCSATVSSSVWDAVGVELQAGSRVQDGVLSLGFDMDPVMSQMFITGGGSISSFTEFGQGYSLAESAGIDNYLVLGESVSTLIVGIRVYLSTLVSSGGGNTRLLLFNDWATNTAQVSLQMETGSGNGGSLGFYLGSNAGGTLIGTIASSVIPQNTWTYLEAKVKIGASGLVELRVNGSSTPVISVSGVNTQESVNSYVGAVVFEGAAPGLGTCYFDDSYFVDTTGASPLNTYLGAVRVYGISPNANSANSARNGFQPTSPTGSNYQNVANVPQNSSEYNYSNVPGTYDMFRYPQSFPGGTILFINEWASIEDDTLPGTRTVVLDCSSGGVDSISTAFIPVAGIINYYNLINTVDPNTSAAWTQSGVISAESGILVES